MYIDEKNAEDSDLLKQLVKVSASTITKDADLALKFESTRAITLANYYISAKEGTLPIIESTGRPGFLAAELNEFNYVEDGVEFYVNSFLKNSAYIGADDKRLKEVSENYIFGGLGDISAEFTSNVFEENKYYRVLCSKYGIDPYVSRKAANFDIIYVDKSLETTDIDLSLYQETYKESQELFTRSMYNKGFEYSDNFKSFIKFFLTTMTITRYTDRKLSDVTRFKNYSAKDLRNLFYSFGFFDDSFVPGSFKESVAKSIYKLINGKATDHAFNIVIDDIFANQDISLKKYVMVKTPKTADSLFDMSAKDMKDPSKFNFDFVKIPYNVKNALKYINDNPEVLEDKITLAEMKKADDYLDPEHGSTDEELKDYEKAILKSGAPCIDTKYIAVEFNAEDMLAIGKKIGILFAMLHYTRDYTQVRSNSLNTDVSFFDLVVAFMYTRALLLTDNNPQYLDTGDRFGTHDRSMLKFKQFLAMLSVIVYRESEKPDNSIFYNLFNLLDGELENEASVSNTPELPDAVSDLAAVSLPIYAAPDRITDVIAYNQDRARALDNLSAVLVHYNKICEFIDDITYAGANIEQYRDTYASEFLDTGTDSTEQKITTGIDLRKDLTPIESTDDKYYFRFNTNERHGDDRTGPDDASFIKGLTHEADAYYPSSYTDDTENNRDTLFFDRLKMYPITEYMELKNTLAGFETLFSKENYIENEKYGNFSNIEDYILDKYEYFRNKIQHILTLDSWKEELSTYSANISAEIDTILANYAIDSVSFGALNSTTIASFAASLITFIKSVTVQTKNNSDNDVEIKISDIPDDKLTPFDNVVYDSHRSEHLYDDGDTYKYNDMMFGGGAYVVFRETFKDDQTRPNNGFASEEELDKIPSEKINEANLSSSDLSILDGTFELDEDLYVHVVKQYGAVFENGVDNENMYPESIIDAEDEEHKPLVPTLNIKEGHILLASTRKIVTRGLLGEGIDNLLDIGGTFTASDVMHAGKDLTGTVSSEERIQRSPEGIPQRRDDSSIESKNQYPAFIHEDGMDYIATERSKDEPDSGDPLGEVFVRESEYDK